MYVYGDDMEIFWRCYNDIIGEGIYNNGKRGTMDLVGINFYSKEQINGIIKRIKVKTPPDYEILLNWLEIGLNYNGFYILGE